MSGNPKKSGMKQYGKFDEFGQRIEGDDDDASSSSSSTVTNTSDENRKAEVTSSQSDDDRGSSVKDNKGKGKTEEGTEGGIGGGVMNWFGEGVEIVEEDDDEETAKKAARPIVQSAEEERKRKAMLMIEGPTATTSADKGAVVGGIAVGLQGPLAPSSASDMMSFTEFLISIPERQRNVCFIGAIHHGKTSVLQGLLSTDQPLRQRADELKRKITLKSSVTTCIAHGQRRRQNILVTAIDTPGHVDFQDEVCCALRLSDTAIVCVDCVEGILPYTEELIRLAALEGNEILLCLTKIDRLILDLRLPPQDAYYKLKVIVDGMNNVLLSLKKPPVLPTRNTVLFSSHKLGALFSLQSFAGLYSEKFPHIDVESLAKRLWGPVSFDSARQMFVPYKFPAKHSFVDFILEPLYKLVSHAVACEGPKLDTTLSKTPASPLAGAREAVISFFKGATFSEALCDALIVSASPHFPRTEKLLHRYAGSDEEPFAAVLGMNRTEGNESIVSVVRVMKGNLQKKKKVLVVNNSENAPEAKITKFGLFTQNGLMPLNGPVPPGLIVFAEGLSEAAEKHALVVDLNVSTASRKKYGEDIDDSYAQMLETGERILPYIAPLRCPVPFVRISVEPRKASHLQTLIRGLQWVTKTYAGSTVTVEDNGERTISGFGELYMDVLLHDLRTVFCKDIELRFSEPFVRFCETIENSQCSGLASSTVDNVELGLTSNKIHAELASAIEQERLDIEFKGPHDSNNSSKMGIGIDRASRNDIAYQRPLGIEKVLQSDSYKWDALSATHVVGFGPRAENGPNILVDDTLEGNLHPQVLESIARGFRRAVERGPLCGENVREARVMIIEALMQPPPAAASSGRKRKITGQKEVGDDEDEEEEEEEGGWVVPSRTRMVSRRASVNFFHAAQTSVHTALALSSMKLMEPVMRVDILTPLTRVDTIRQVLLPRRGHVVQEHPCAGSPLFLVKAIIPTIEMFGFETELRVRTAGESFPNCRFDHWATVPGDPIDETVAPLGVLQPAQGFQLARDFLIKTRRRKGLPENIEF